MNSEKSKRNFIVMVGVVGSGKSTKANQLASSIRNSHPKYDDLGQADIVDVISSDNIREKFLGDINDQTKNDIVFSIVHKEIREGLLKNHHVIVDATNISIKSRRSILDCMACLTEEKKKNFNVVAYVMTTPISVCKKQNANRDRVVPEFVIDRQLEKYEIPFKEEGFTEICLDNWEYLWCKGNSFNGAKKTDVQKVVDLMKGFNQRTKHHVYTLDIHCEKVVEELKKRTNNKVLIRAGYIHDIGKIYTGKPKDDDSGDYCYYSHHNVGTYSLLQNLDLVGFCDIERTLELLFYVNYHMQPFFINSEKAEKKWKRIFGEEKYNNLFLFNECDIIGSGRE